MRFGIVTVILLVGACQEIQVPVGPTPGRPRFDGEAALELVRTQVAFGPRVPGTEAHLQQLDWMVARLSALAPEVSVDTFSHVTVAGDSLELFNVSARFRPEATRRILLLAHWDTRPQSDRAADVERQTIPVPGANDGGSGTAVLLQLAELLAGAAPPMGVDLLFVVGEEAGSDGARAAASLPATSRWMVNGEPTESSLVSASKGSQRLVIRARGQEAHSAYPALGRSAVEAMVSLLGELRGLKLPTDRELGETTVNVGLIRGGSAANVFAGECEVELMIRLIGDVGVVKEAIAGLIDDRAELTWGSHIPPQRYHIVDGFGTTTVAYTSDVPILSAWGTPLMFGPGSIHHAHTGEEHVPIEELRGAVDAYERIVRGLLAS